MKVATIKLIYLFFLFPSEALSFLPERRQLGLRNFALAPHLQRYYKDIRIRRAHHRAPNFLWAPKWQKNKDFSQGPSIPVAPKYGIFGWKMGLRKTSWSEQSHTRDFLWISPTNDRLQIRVDQGEKLDEKNLVKKNLVKKNYGYKKCWLTKKNGLIIFLVEKSFC